MATTGATAPTTNGFDIWGFGPGGADEFTNPENIYSDDGNYATAGNAGSNDYQSYGGFGFSIPTGSTIDGIEVKVESHKSDSAGQGIEFSLYEVTTAYRTKSYDPNQTTDTVVTLGSSSDVWGGSWEASDFDNFYLYIQVPATAQTISFDYFTVEVFYTPPATSDVKKNNLLLTNVG